jgi:peptidoglycan/xylan/chitin deacetylase (PgdA/CDA1 family)
MTPFVCLMYHNVCRPESLRPDGPFAGLSRSIQSYSVTSDQFRQHLSVIETSRWLGPDEVWQESGSTNLTPRVLLTFDDGWAGTFEEAGPILEQFHAQAYVFVTTGLIGHSLFASRATLQSLDRGPFRIGAHTVSHPFLAECRADFIQRELSESKAELEDIVGRPIDAVSIPNGSMDARVLRIARECGYRFVFGSEPGVNATLSDGPIRRLAVRSTTTADHIRLWCSGEMATSRWRRGLLESAKVVLGPRQYRTLRAWALGDEADEMSDLIRSHHAASLSAATLAQ